MRRVLFVLLLLVSLPCAAAPAVDDRELSVPKRGDRILIVAPHIDDEALAAGGYAQDAVDAGADVFIVYLTAGDHSRTALAANRLTFFATARLNRKGQRRIAEGERAARLFGLDDAHLFNLGYPDRGLRRMLLHPDRVIRSASTGKRAVPYAEAVSPGAPYRLDSMLEDLAYVIETVQPNIVIAPIAQDRHSDHRTAAVLVDRILEDLDVHAERLGYRIHGHLRRVADDDWVVYPLSDETARRKRALLAQYRSQRRTPYMKALFRLFSGKRELFLRMTSIAAATTD